MKRVGLTLTVNGEAQVLQIDSQATLLEVLREELGLTGAKEGCGEGVCGSCTVLLNGAPVRACLTVALEADGAHVTTVEGMATGDQLDPLQQAFIDHGAVQCGFCTAGVLISAKALLETHPHADQEAIKRTLGGHVCRCTGYTKMVEAVAAVANEGVPTNGRKG